MKLSPKQETFSRQYVIDLNGTQAAIRAGYSKRTAKEQATRLLTNVHVRQFIKELRKTLSEKTDITAERVLRELEKIGFNNLQDYIEKGNTVKDLKSIKREYAASVESIKITERTIGTGKDKIKEVTTAFKLHDKVSALEKLGRHLGIFEADNKQQTNKVTIKVTAKKQ